MLEEISGNLLSRSPTVGMSTVKKLLYVALPGFNLPNAQSNLNMQLKFQAPLPAHEAFISFNKRLNEWGLTEDVTPEWTLIIDARDEIFTPHDAMGTGLAKLNDRFKKIVILSSSIHSTENSPYEHYFYPLACLNLDNWYDKLQEENVDWENVTLQKHFIIMCRRPSYNRVLMVKDMLDLYKEDTRASCGSTNLKITHRPRLLSAPQLVWNDMQNVRQARHHKETAPNLNEPVDGDNARTNTYGFQVNDYGKLFSPYEYPMFIDGVISSPTGITTMGDLFYSNMVHIVCETLERDNQAINISEKSYKPFAWRQIPIWHASPGTVQVVRDMGFDMFDDIFDHSYDTITPYENKKEFILNEIKKFKEKYPTLESIQTLRKELYPRLESNNNLLARHVEEQRQWSPHHDWPKKIFKQSTQK